MAAKYTDQVFINCPFDDEFTPLFEAVVFAVFDCGFTARCALEVGDTSETRLRAIMNLMGECRYGVHDLSRVQLDRDSGLPRFNMPFELGIFMSAKHFGDTDQRRKRVLVLERERYRYQRFISDLAGVDIVAHNDSPSRAIMGVRNWLRTASRRETIPAGATIQRRYSRFADDFRDACADAGIESSDMPFVEFTLNISQWLRLHSAGATRLFDN